ncbi:MAG: hypothetical protein AB7D28_07900 [Candidatus Berkiella sp.]
MDLYLWAAIATIVGTLLAVFYAIKKFTSWYHQRNIYRVEDKEVTLRWLEQTPLKQGWEDQGYRLAWPLLKELEIKKSEGWEVMYEVDDKNKIKYRFVVINNPDHLLMGKKAS